MYLLANILHIRKPIALKYYILFTAISHQLRLFAALFVQVGMSMDFAVLGALHKMIVKK